MRTALTIAGWAAAGIFGGSTLILVVWFALDERQFRKVNAQARRR